MEARYEHNTIMDRIIGLEMEIVLLKNEVDRLNFIIENMRVDPKESILTLDNINDQDDPNECLMCGS